MAAYIPGYLNGPDVAGFGFNTQSAMFYNSMHAQLDVHNGVQCDGCGASPLRGIRWKCQSCPDHDICNNCKKAGNSPGHPFQIVSMTTTNNQMAAATGQQQQPESGVHWTTCKSCNTYPIRGTMYACRVCPNFDLCDPCNKQRIASSTHQHYFEFFFTPRACNPPPQAAGGPVQPLQQREPAATQVHQGVNQQQPLILVVQQGAQEETWVPPPPVNHPFIPRGGSGDDYYHEATYAPKSVDHIPRPIATARETYMAQADDELSFPEGGRVLVTGFPSKGWWLGEWKGLRGLFPSHLVDLDAIENHAAYEGYWV